MTIESKVINGCVVGNTEYGLWAQIPRDKFDHTHQKVHYTAAPYIEMGICPACLMTTAMVSWYVI